MARPAACSADTYGTVPRITPALVGFVIVTIWESRSPLAGAGFASPKSRIFANPSSRTMMFSGFKFR